MKKLAEQVLAADERRQARDCTAGEYAHLIDALTDAAPALARETHFDALRRGLSPGKYRLIAALVRAEDEATS